MSSGTRVLVVGADLDERAQIKRQLTDLDYTIVGEAPPGVEATGLALRERPELILLAIAEPTAVSFHAAASLQAVAPEATLVMSTKLDPQPYVQRAMQAGARGLLHEGLAADEVATLLEVACAGHLQQVHLLRRADGQLAAQGAGISSGTVLAVFGPKGGVGKTVVATNLAIALQAHTGARVVIVDADPYFGDVAIELGITPVRSIADLLQDMDDGRTVDIKTYLTQHPSGVWILPSRHSAQVRASVDPDGIAQIIRTLAISFDYVVVDNPGVISQTVLSVLDESTLALLISSADLASIKDAKILIDALREEGVREEFLRLVVNRGTMARDLTDREITRAVGYPISWSLPHDSNVPDSTQRGEPMVLGNPRSPFSVRIGEMGRQVSGQPRIIQSDEPGVAGGRRWFRAKRKTSHGAVRP